MRAELNSMPLNSFAAVNTRVTAAVYYDLINLF